MIALAARRPKPTAVAVAGAGGERRPAQHARTLPADWSLSLAKPAQSWWVDDVRVDTP